MNNKIKVAHYQALDVAMSRMTPKKAREHQAWWNDKQRSSMNDIGKGALALAARLRKIGAGETSGGPLPKAAPIILVSH